MMSSRYPGQPGNILSNAAEASKKADVIAFLSRPEAEGLQEESVVLTAVASTKVIDIKKNNLKHTKALHQSVTVT